MLLPGHLAALHVTTCGQSGAGLGSDEKEVVLLIYVIIDVQTNNVSNKALRQLQSSHCVCIPLQE